jgi:putative ABC transport system permease protein
MKDYFNFAFQNIRHRQVRSWLTIIGIIIGIGAIVALISLSQGLENAISAQFENLGSNKIYVFPKAVGSFGFVFESIITEDDVDLLEGFTGVEAVNQYLYEKTDVEYGNEELYTGVTGFKTEKIPQEVMEGQGIKLSEGRWPKKDEEGITIIGSKIAADSYKKEIFLGNRIEIEGLKFRVIGIMESLGNEEDDTNVWISIDEARIIHEKEEELTFLEVVAVEGTDIPTLAEKVERKLERSRGEEDLEIMIPEQILGQLSNILDILKVVLGGIAAISLLVGGVGIMNSMYTNVLERKKEIGILKAIGATPKDIKYIFMFEAGIIGLAGGILGALAGVLVSFAVGEAAKKAGFIFLKIQVEYPIVIFSILFAFVIGVIAGYLPARDAAKLLPVEALRE